MQYPPCRLAMILLSNRLKGGCDSNNEQKYENEIWKQLADRETYMPLSSSSVFRV